MAILNSVYISAYVAYVVEARWLFPAALLTILVPAYLLGRSNTDRPKKDHQRFTKVSEKASPAAIKRAVRRANFVNYGLLYAVMAIRLVHSQF
jgi:hypothetical protein